MSTFMLVHGAWNGPRCWDKVSPHLTRRGHTVVTPELPSETAGAGLPEYLAVIETALGPHSDVVLVAHSMSGLLAPLAAGNSAVAAIVLLSAMTPQPGKAWLENGPAAYAEPMLRLLPAMHHDDLDLSWWDPADATELMYQDCPPQEAAEAVRMMRRDSEVIYRQPCPEFPVREVPVTYVACCADRALNDLWNAMIAAEMLDADLRRLPAGHSPFWTAPEELAMLLEDLH